MGILSRYGFDRFFKLRDTPSSYLGQTGRGLVVNSAENALEFKNLAPTNNAIINSVNDLPTPTDTGDGLGTAYRLVNNMKYVFGASMTLSYPIVMNTNYLEGTRGVSITYAGSGALFRNNSTTPLGASTLFELNLFGDGTNELFDITAGNTFDMEVSGASNFKGGEVKNLSGKCMFKGFTLSLYLQRLHSIIKESSLAL